MEKFDKEISIFLQDNISIFTPADIVKIMNIYAWPFIVLLAICKFGDSIANILLNVKNIQLKFKDYISLLIGVVQNDPILDQTLDGVRKKKTDNVLNELLEDVGRKIDSHIK